MGVYKFILPLILVLIVPIFSMAKSPQSVLGFQYFLSSYLKYSQAGLSAVNQRDRSLTGSQIDKDQYQGELGAVPRLSHEDRTFFTAIPQETYNRSSDVEAYYKQSLSTGTSLALRGQKFIAKSNPLVNSIDSKYSLSLSQQLYRNAFGSSQRAQINRANIDIQVALMEYRQAEVAVCQEAFNLFTDAYIQQERWKLLSEQLKDAKKAFSVSKKLYRDRLTHKMDFLSSESDFIQTQNDVERARQSLENGKRQLAIFMGTKSGGQFTLATPKSFVPPVPPQVSKAPTLALNIANKKTESAELEIDNVKSAIRPEVALGVELGQREGRLNGPNGTSPFEDEYINASLTLSLPTFNRTNSAKLNLALSQKNNAVLQKSLAQQNQPVIIENLYTTEKLLRTQVQSSSRRLDLLNEKDRLAFRTMKSGNMEFENYLLHRNAYRNHQNSHLQLQKELWESQFSIHKELAQPQGSFCRGGLVKGLIQYFINRSFVVNLISAFIILAGVLLGSQIRRDLVPPFEMKSIRVTGSLPGGSATEVEKFLTYPIENALQGLPGAIESSSRSTEGSFNLRINFAADYKDIDDAIKTVQSRLDSVRWQLPETSRDIMVRQIKNDSIFHMALALENFNESNSEHRKMAKNFVDEVTALTGIVRVSLDMNDQNVYVNLDPKAMLRHEISIADVRQRVRQALNFSPIGKVEYKEQTFSIEVKRPAEAVEALNSLALRSNRTGDTLRLEDIGSVSLEIDEIKQHHRFNGKPSIFTYVFKDTTTDTIDLKDKVYAIIGRVNKSLPEGMQISPVIETPGFIQTQLSTLSGNALFGLCLVLLILTLFFNFKIALVTSFGIPIAYCGTLVALYMLGISIDLISVVAMILVLGILVDDAIIVAERYMENLENGMKSKAAAIAASSDLMLPVTGTVLTTVFAFSPMLLIANEMATIFYAIPVVIITSLAISWIESFFILPNHLHHFIKKPSRKAAESDFVGKMRRSYRKVLSGIIKYRYVAIVLLCAFMGLSAWIAKNKIQHEYSFRPDLERIVLKVTLKEGVTLDDAERIVGPIEQYLLQLPKKDIQNVSTHVGQIWTRGRVYNGNRYVRISAYINKDDIRPLSTKKKYKKIIDEKMKEFKTDEFEKIEVRAGYRSDRETKKEMVSIEVKGHEDIDFSTLKASIKEQMTTSAPDLELIQDQNTFDKKWLFEPNIQKLSQHRISQSQLTQQLRSYFVPHELTQIRVDGETRWLYTQIKRTNSISAKELSNMVVLNSRGLSVPLKSIGRWNQSQQLARIRHKNNKRIFSFDLAFDPEKNMNVIKAKEQANATVSALNIKFPTYSMAVMDADEEETDRRNWAFKVGILCIALVLFTIALVLGSLTLPFIVGLPIPFGLLGIIWALYLHDMTMGMMSLVGLIGTVGVSVNDSLIMVDQINKRAAARGHMTRDDILDGATSRLRAILLTTITTLGGVFPMAYGIGGESGFTQPLAFSIGWGLFFSTFLTLFALPAFIEIRQDVTGITMKIFSRFKKDSSYNPIDLVQPIGKKAPQQPKSASRKTTVPPDLQH